MTRLYLLLRVSSFGLLGLEPIQLRMKRISFFRLHSFVHLSSSHHLSGFGEMELVLKYEQLQIVPDIVHFCQRFQDGDQLEKISV